MNSYFSNLFFAVFICIFSIGCGGSGGGSDTGEGSSNSATISSLTFATLIVGIDSNASVTYTSSGNTNISATVTGAPSESQMLNLKYSGASFSLSFDAVGQYQFLVSMTDNKGTITRKFTFDIINNAPVSAIKGLIKSNLFEKLSLDGGESIDIDGHELTYDWSVVSKPTGSDITVTDSQSVVGIFYPDVKGDYTIQLSVSDGYGGENSSRFDFSIGVYKFRRTIFNVIDAVYNPNLDKLIVVGDDKKLYLYSLEDHNTQVISLGYQGSSVSVLPDGSKAAVGHDGNISLVNLATLSVEREYSISTNVFDLEISTNGYVYAMPKTDQWESLRALNLSNGEETLQNGSLVRAGTSIKMHPSQDYIYGADRGLSPSDIEKYDIRNGTSTYLYDSPYHGDYSMCGDLWMSKDGLRIFTRCGNVFRASEIQEQDMTYNGKIESSGQILSLDHLGDNVVFVDESESNFLNFYSYEILEDKGREELPVAILGDQFYSTEGRFVFYRKDGSEIALVEIDNASGLLFNFGVSYVPSGIENFNLSPLAIVEDNKYVNINEQTSISAEQSFDPEGDELSYSWEIIAKPETSTATLVTDKEVTTTFTPDVKGDYYVKVSVNDGINESSFAAIIISVEDPNDKQLIELDFQVTASAYSKSIDRLIMLSISPSRLIIYDTDSENYESISLSESSSVLSLNLAQNVAVVGHSNSVTTIDLVNKEIIDTYPVSSNIIDLAMPDNGFLYVFPETDQWERIRTIDLISKEETSHTGNFIRAGTLVDMHPSGNYIYGADNGLSPSDIELYDVSMGNANYVTDSPYHGDYDMCGNIWVAQDGNSLFTRCGNVFKSNPTQNDDMTYLGNMNVAESIKELSQSGNEIAIVNFNRFSNGGNIEIGHVINLYDYSNLAFVRSVEIPTSYISGNTYKNYGENIFHNSDGGKIIVLTKIDPNAGKLNEFSLFLYTQ